MEAVKGWLDLLMAKHLTDKDIARVVELLDGWKSELTWKHLCKACKVALGSEPARQTLDRSARIREAFRLTKGRIKEGQSNVGSSTPSMRVAVERIARLTAENERLKLENDRLLEQFVVWQYNAYARGLRDVDINRPLPKIDRRQS